MGLWEFCFNHFRYPNYQFDKLFDGCHYIFSQEYYVIWEWLLPGIYFLIIQSDLIFECCRMKINELTRPSRLFNSRLIRSGWLMTVQAFMTLSLIISCLAQISATLLLVRWPLNFTFRYQWQILGTCMILNASKAFTLFLSVAVFGGQCWRRDWLLYPNFNYLSWSYAFAVISMGLAAGAAYCFYTVS